jgi:hypothetical protein
VQHDVAVPGGRLCLPGARFDAVVSGLRAGHC